MTTESNQTEMSLADIVADIDAAVEAETDAQLELDLQQPAEADDVSDENVTTDENPDTDEQAPDTAEVLPNVSEDEKAARAQGWRPKEEWTGPPDKWVDAGEFNRRTELFEKIGSQNKAIKDLNKKLDALINHNQGLERRTREKVLAELNAKKREAVSFGDTEAFDAAEAQIEELKNQESALKIEDEPEPEPQAQAQKEIPQPIKDFADRNSKWFEKDREMTDFAVFKVQQLINSGIAIDEALTQAEAAVKATFAAKFTPAANPKKAKPSAVMSGQTEARPKTGKSYSDLTSEQKQVWRALEGTMTLDEFLTQIED